MKLQKLNLFKSHAVQVARICMKDDRLAGLCTGDKPTTPTERATPTHQCRAQLACHPPCKSWPPELRGTWKEVLAAETTAIESLNEFDDRFYPVLEICCKLQLEIIFQLKDTVFTLSAVAKWVIYLPPPTPNTTLVNFFKIEQNQNFKPKFGTK